MELAALNVKITGDASGLKSAVGQAQASLDGVAKSAATAQTRSAGLSGAFGRLGEVSGQTRSRIQNVGFQLQDVAVQLQSGTRASVVFAQQGSQILSVFGPVGSILGALAAITIPALAFAFGSASSAATTLDDRLEALKGTAETLRTAQDILKMSTDELIAKYGDLATKVREYAVIQAELEVANATRRMQDQVIVMDDLVRKYVNANNAGRDYANTLARIERDFGLTNEQAREFESLMQAMQQATTSGEQEAALAAILEYLKASNISLGEIPPEIARAISEMITLQRELAMVRDLAREAADETANIGLGQTTGVPLDPNRTDLLPPASTPGRRGGGARTNPIVGQLESLRNSLMTQEEAQIASFARQQETLQSALEQRLLTQQEYQALMEAAQMQHAEKLAQIDVYRYGSSLDQAQTFFGDMANAMQGGGEKMLRISKAFGAAEALISAWKGAAKALELPFPANLAAFAQVLATGFGAVNAIKSVGKGGTGGGGGGASAVPAAASDGGVSQNVAIQLVGGELFSRSQVVTLINKINEAVEGGAKLRIV